MCATGLFEGEGGGSKALDLREVGTPDFVPYPKTPKPQT